MEVGLPASLIDGLTQISTVTYVICIVVVVLILRLYSLDRPEDVPLPPSPRFCLPVLGHLLQLNRDFRVTFGKFRRQFGDVYGFYLGWRYTVVIGGYEAITEAFKTGSLFVDRPDMYLLDKISKKLGVGGVNGAVWRDHRRFALSTLKDFGLGRSILENKIHAEAKLLLKAIKMKNGNPFDPREVLTTTASNVICTITFGNSFKHGDERFKKLMKHFTELNEAIGSTAMVNVMPFLAHLPGDPLHAQRVLRAAEHRFAFTKEIIDEHLKTYDENIIEDYTSAFIKTMTQKQLSDEPTSFTLDQLSGVICDLFVAGSDTTANTLRWSLVCLINFPETQAHMHGIINTHVGTGRLPSLKDKVALSYVQAFYSEALRYCELGVASFPYKASTDVELKGFRIPKDTVVLADMHSVWTDKDIWGDPENFRPERFLNEDGTFRTQKESIPFFLGKRRCMGESLARMELFLFISALVQNFIFEAPEGEDVSVRSVDGIFGASHVPKPFRIVARARHQAISS